jgi:hypothetical protein
VELHGSGEEKSSMSGLVLESLVKSHDDILIAALLEAEKPLDWYVREGMQVPKEETWRQMIIKVQILMSMVKDASGYLGDFKHMSVQHDLAVVHLFPVGRQKVLCVVSKPESESKLIALVRRFIEKINEP